MIEEDKENAQYRFFVNGAEYISRMSDHMMNRKAVVII